MRLEDKRIGLFVSFVLFIFHSLFRFLIAMVFIVFMLDYFDVPVSFYNFAFWLAVAMGWVFYPLINVKVKTNLVK